MAEEGYIRIPHVPGGCLKCRLSNACEGKCAWVERKIDDANTRPVWCPIRTGSGTKVFSGPRAGRQGA